MNQRTHSEQQRCASAPACTSGTSVPFLGRIQSSVSASAITNRAKRCAACRAPGRGGLRGIARLGLSRTAASTTRTASPTTQLPSHETYCAQIHAAWHMYCTDWPQYKLLQAYTAVTSWYGPQSTVVYISGTIRCCQHGTWARVPRSQTSSQRLWCFVFRNYTASMRLPRETTAPSPPDSRPLRRRLHRNPVFPLSEH